MKPEVKISLIYAAIGMLWIAFSDTYLGLLFQGMDTGTLVQFQLLKGISYVTITAMVLYVLVKRYNQSLMVKVTELEQLNTALTRQTRNAELAKQELEHVTGVASIEIEEPLRMFRRFMDQLQQRYGSQMDAKSLKYIDFAREGALRIQKIIRDLLEYSRGGDCENEVTTFALRELTSEIQIDLRKMIKEHQASILVGDLPEITTNKDKLKIELNHIVHNAIQFHQQGIPPQISITARQNTNHLDIMVTDNGIGIAPEELPSIFQLFYRTKSTAGSSHTGLGLALAKKIMLQIGGDIHVTSVCNQGSVFTVSVPVTEYQGDPDV